MKLIFKRLLKNPKAMVIVLVLLICFIAFFSIIVIKHDKLIVGIIFSLLVFFIGALSGPVSIRLFGYYHVGFDLIPFSAICFFYSYDFMTGLLAAIGMQAFSCIATKQFSIGHMVEILGYAFIGILSIFIHLNPFVNGMILVVIWNAFVFLIFYFLRIASPNEWIRITGSLLLHFVLFKYAAEFILKLI